MQGPDLFFKCLDQKQKLIDQNEDLKKELARLSSKFSPVERVKPWPKKLYPWNEELFHEIPFYLGLNTKNMSLQSILDYITDGQATAGEEKWTSNGTIYTIITEDTGKEYVLKQYFYNESNPDEYLRLILEQVRIVNQLQKLKQHPLEIYATGVFDHHFSFVVIERSHETLKTLTIHGDEKIKAYLKITKIFYKLMQNGVLHYNFYPDYVHLVRRSNGKYRVRLDPEVPMLIRTDPEEYVGFYTDQAKELFAEYLSRQDVREQYGQIVDALEIEWKKGFDAFLEYFFMLNFVLYFVAALPFGTDEERQAFLGLLPENFGEFGEKIWNMTYLYTGSDQVRHHVITFLKPMGEIMLKTFALGYTTVCRSMFRPALCGINLIS